jgi:hypothetical protein
MPQKRVKEARESKRSKREEEYSAKNIAEEI